MARVIGTIAILVGITLVVLGIISTQKTGEKVMGEMTGHYTNQTVWYIVGGIALVAAGFGIRRMGKK
jgi:hypothetical protein